MLHVCRVCVQTVMAKLGGQSYIITSHYNVFTQSYLGWDICCCLVIKFCTTYRRHVSSFCGSLGK